MFDFIRAILTYLFKKKETPLKTAYSFFLGICCVVVFSYMTLLIVVIMGMFFKESFLFISTAIEKTYSFLIPSFLFVVCYLVAVMVHKKKPD